MMNVTMPNRTSESNQQSNALSDVALHDDSGQESLLPPAEQPSRTTTPSAPSGKAHLEPPPHIPHRPLSPSTLSNFSIDDDRSWNERSKQNRQIDQSTWKGKLRACWDRNLGLLYMVLAQVFGTAMNVTIRFLEVEGNNGNGLHPFQILFARMSITAFLASVYMWYTKTPYFPFGMPEVRSLLVIRGLGGFFGVIGMYYSLLYLPLSDATVITFLAPGLSCWACSFLIKEPFTRIEKLGTLVSLVGVVFIARPTSLFKAFYSSPPASGGSDGMPSTNGTASSGDASDFDHVTPEQRIAAVGIALVGVCGAVCAFVTIRWIGKRAHPLISVNYFAVWCTIVSLVVQLAVPKIGFLFPTNLKEWAMLIFLGICGFIMQFLLAAGLSYEKSSRATNMTYTSMLFALACDKIFFDTSPSVTSVLGSILILGAAITMAISKGNAEQENKPREEGRADEERGLMGAVDGEERPQERMPIQEVQMRALR